MAIIRSSDFPSFPSLSNLMRGDVWDWMNSSFLDKDSLPAVNVREEDKEYVIEVAAPGMKKDDFKINLDKGMLTISSEKREETNSDNDGSSYRRKEFNYQSFRRTFSIPDEEVDAENINAKYEDGILCITIPKREVTKTKQSKEIKVS